MAKNRSRSGGNGTTAQVTFRIPTDWIARADAIAGKLSKDAAPASRTDSLRLALARGFRELEREYKIAGGRP